MSIIPVLAVDGPGHECPIESELPHVLLVLDQFPKALGGGERIALRIAELLPNYGYRASILTFSIHRESAVLKSAPCPVYLLPLSRTYDLKAFRSAFALRGFLKQHKVQIVQTFFESSDIWGGFVTKAMSRAKLVWSRRDMGILRTRKHRIAYRLMAGLPDAVFAVSEQVRQYCIDVDGIAASRVRTIFNGLDLSGWSLITKGARAPGEIVVATVGNIRRVKGHDILIKAASVILSQYPNVSFSIAGEVIEQDYFEELQRLLSELKLTDRFHFVGAVTELRNYLSSADIFVLPSRSEGFSNAIVEAMAASLPVVATNVGGNSEAVEDGTTGIIVASEDVTALSGAILRLLANPSIAEEMGIAGRARAGQRFTTDSMMRQMAAAYRQLLSQG